MPKVGEPIPEGVKMLKYYFNAGYEVIIFTARPGDHKPMIYNWLQEQGLEDYVYEVRCGKPVSGLYIDDRAWRPPYV
jgi:hypothetical protein